MELAARGCPSGDASEGEGLTVKLLDGPVQLNESLALTTSASVACFYPLPDGSDGVVNLHSTPDRINGESFEPV